MPRGVSFRALASHPARLPRSALLFGYLGQYDLLPAGLTRDRWLSGHRRRVLHL